MTTYSLKSTSRVLVVACALTMAASAAASAGQAQSPPGGNVFKITKEGNPPAVERTKHTAEAGGLYFRQIVGQAKSSSGGIDALTIDGRKLTLKDKQFKDGTLQTDELGALRLEFSNNILKLDFAVLLTAEQIKKLEELLSNK